MTWAAVAQQPARSLPEPVPDGTPALAGTTAILDASAIIAGFHRQVADNLATVSEVLDECKDAVAKQRLHLLPEGIQVQQPTAEAVKRGD